jgi:cytochrome P450
MSWVCVSSSSLPVWTPSRLAWAFNSFTSPRNPKQQAQLRAHPEMIPQAVEELLRFYSIVNPIRTATKQSCAIWMRSESFE